jgi:hypothetical protein
MVAISEIISGFSVLIRMAETRPGLRRAIGTNTARLFALLASIASNTAFPRPQRRSKFGLTVLREPHMRLIAYGRRILNGDGKCSVPQHAWSMTT